MKGKNEYPPDWKIIRHRAYERAHWQCEHCGLQFTPGSTQHPTAKRLDDKPITLTIHHLDGDRANSDWTNLLCCCQSCHLHIQALWQPGWPLPAVWYAPPPWLVRRDLNFLVQLRLPEV